MLRSHDVLPGGLAGIVFGRPPSLLPVIRIGDIGKPLIRENRGK
ncbi:hypothetical protein [Streptomyces sp. CA-251251]